MKNEKKDTKAEEVKKIIFPDIGLLGKKIGMSRLFSEDGKSFPVTLLDVSSNRVSQIKSSGKDGYDSYQLAFDNKKKNRVTKSLAGHCSKAGIQAPRILREFRVKSDLTDESNIKAGDQVTAEIFKEGQLLDITGITQGKGFQGAIKRHGFSSQRATHGNSISHRAPGSIGMCQDPGRVFKGKRMAGHMGRSKVTIQNLTLLRIDTDKQILIVKGAVPGSKGSDVVVRSAIKTKSKKIN